MTAKTYTGSCHCGLVKYEADIDFSQGSNKCNCTFCTKVRNWCVFIKPESLRVKSGENDLIGYKARPETSALHTFCKVCGVRTFERGFLEHLGGDYVSIFVASLDNASADEIMSGAIRHANGLDNDWTNVPADIRTL